MHLQQTKRGSRDSGGPQYYFHNLTDSVKTYLRVKGSVRVALVTPYGATKTDYFAVSTDRKLDKHLRPVAGNVGHDRIQQGRAAESIGEAIRVWYKLPAGDFERLEPFTKDKVLQIDLIWLDAKRAAFAFEVEHSTSITTGIDRFIELLRVDRATAERLVIVAPRSRQKKMNQVLGSSHYIGAPMYMEAKVRYLWYSDVLEIMSRFEGQQPTKPNLAAAITGALHTPKAKPV